jgi:hypothetical protein
MLARSGSKMLAKRRWGTDRGSTTVEFAVVLPFFLLLTFGIIDFGWYFFVEHTLQYATREGMRLAVVGGRLKDKDNQDLSRLDSIYEKIRKEASLAVDPWSLTIIVYTIPIDGSEPDEVTTSAGDPGSYMRVKTSYTYRFLTPVIGGLFPDGMITIEAQGTYRNEQFET